LFCAFLARNFLEIFNFSCRGSFPSSQRAENNPWHTLDKIHVLLFPSPVNIKPCSLISDYICNVGKPASCFYSCVLNRYHIPYVTFRGHNVAPQIPRRAWVETHRCPSPITGLFAGKLPPVENFVYWMTVRTLSRSSVIEAGTGPRRSCVDEHIKYCSSGAPLKIQFFGRLPVQMAQLPTFLIPLLGIGAYTLRSVRSFRIPL